MAEKKHWSDNKGVFKKSERFTEVQDVKYLYLDLSSQLVDVCKN